MALLPTCSGFSNDRLPSVGEDAEVEGALLAADAVDKQVCSLEDADKAMRYGVNYPQGPFIWADQIGVEWVHNTLANLAHHICASRYAENPWIAKHVLEQRNFYA